MNHTPEFFRINFKRSDDLYGWAASQKKFQQRAAYISDTGNYGFLLLRCKYKRLDFLQEFFYIIAACGGAGISNNHQVPSNLSGCYTRS